VSAYPKALPSASVAASTNGNDRALEQCKKLVVADRGINSKLNLKRIDGKKYRYIVASRIRKMNKELTQKLFDKEIASEINWVLDEAAIKRDEQFDGYYGLQTNDHSLKPQDLLDAYHCLWKIEESFRIMKSTLEVRPVFHWTESRIKGHFVVCFLAFLLERTLELRLKEAGISASPEKIREALNAMCFTKMDVEQNTFYIKMKGTDLSSKIWSVLKLKHPKNITPAEELVL